MSGDDRLSKDSGRVQTPAFENGLPDAGIPLTKLGSRNTPNNASFKGPLAEVSSISNDNPGLDSKTSQVLARVQYLSLCFTLFLAGWNDGTIGPLLPRIQEVYNVCTPPRHHQLYVSYETPRRSTSQLYRPFSYLLAS